MSPRRQPQIHLHWSPPRTRTLQNTAEQKPTGKVASDVQYPFFSIQTSLLYSDELEGKIILKKKITASI